MPVYSSLLLLMIFAVFFNANLARGSSNCQAHYEVLGKEKAEAVYGAISRVMYGARGSETITGNGYTVTISPKGKCSVVIDMKDAATSLVCSETITLCLDDLPPEEANRLILQHEKEEQERQKRLQQFQEESAAFMETRDREKKKALEEHQKQLLEGVPQEYLDNPAKYLPAICNKYNLELKKVRSCQNDSECGQIMEDTSCGCTRALIARKNADLTKFKELRKTASALLRISSTSPDECVYAATPCDCPEANGFLCVENICTWNYTRAITHETSQNE